MPWFPQKSVSDSLSFPPSTLYSTHVSPLFSRFLFLFLFSYNLFTSPFCLFPLLCSFLLWSFFYFNFKNWTPPKTKALTCLLGWVSTFISASLSFSLLHFLIFTLSLSLSLLVLGFDLKQAFWFGLLWLKGMLCSRKMFSFLVRKDIKKVLKRKDSDAGHKGN